jgi:hypothetical protein
MLIINVCTHGVIYFRSSPFSMPPTIDFQQPGREVHTQASKGYNLPEKLMLKQVDVWPYVLHSVQSSFSSMQPIAYLWCHQISLFSSQPTNPWARPFQPSSVERLTGFFSVRSWQTNNHCLPCIIITSILSFISLSPRLG